MYIHDIYVQQQHPTISQLQNVMLFSWMLASTVSILQSYEKTPLHTTTSWGNPGNGISRANLHRKKLGI